MKNIELIRTAEALMADNKGLLAMDESIASCNRRFREVGIPETEEYRRAYRELIVTTPQLSECLSGAILFDETVYQSTKDGILFVDALKNAGVIPGIKVDEGLVSLAGFPGEKITAGLDTLRDRLVHYQMLGLRFAKWRAVINIGDDIPRSGAIQANMHLLARYAALCQEAGIVPIVEPEVLMDGSHSIQKCFEVTERVLGILFRQLVSQRVDLKGVILKPNMILPGIKSAQHVTDEDVAEATMSCLLQNVPAIVPGIAFLSGGQSARLATSRLNAMHVKFDGKLPWALTFSYSRAVQQPALEFWKGKTENVAGAQMLLYQRLKLNKMARSGRYVESMEND